MKEYVKYAKKACNIFFWILDKISRKTYKKIYPYYLKWLGVKIDTEKIDNMWINPNVFLDSSDYSLIEIRGGVTISFGVSILVHDYSIAHACKAVYGSTELLKSQIYRPVKIGKNVFVGANSLILPGTIIGDNCIIGGGSTVKGNLDANGIYCGNPAKKIGTVDILCEKYKDLLIERKR